jgi:hypothetical protein
MFWPYRPRSGYPSVPTPLLLLLVMAAVVLTLLLLSLFGEGNPGDNYGPL